MARTIKLHELCHVLRSKNASPFLTTIDLFFDDPEKYRVVRESAVLSREKIAEVYKIPVEYVLTINSSDEALGIKITIVKPGAVASGDPGTADIFGAQQYVPLRDVEIPMW